MLLSGAIYVDSPRINDYPIIYAQAIEYDVKVGDAGIGNVTQARAKLMELAEADFEAGIDLPTVGLDVDFTALGETEEYKKYADLEAVHLYDTVRVIAKDAGIDAAVRVTGYKWDALGRRYESVTLGEIASLKTTVYGYELQRGSVKTIKIANGAVGSAQLRDLAVQYAHINTAAVEQLSAGSLTALKAYIHELAAESVTTDQLYADLASIALAQIHHGEHRKREYRLGEHRRAVGEYRDHRQGAPCRRGHRMGGHRQPDRRRGRHRRGEDRRGEHRQRADRRPRSCGGADYPRAGGDGRI